MEIQSRAMNVKVHHGRNVRRFREILGIQMETLARQLDITPQVMSQYEQQVDIGDDILEKISGIFKIPADAIKSFSEDAAINVVSNVFTDSFHENASFIGYKPTFNPIDKVAELYERLLKSEQEKVAMLRQLLEK